MKIARIIIIISILLISCNKQKKFIKIINNPYIEYSKEGYNISIYISDFSIGKGNELNNQGIDFARKKKFDKAREKFIQSLSLEPNDPVILNNLGNIEYQEKKFEKAIEYFEKSLISSDSLYISAGINLGKTYSLIGEKEKSELLFKAIIAKTNIDFLKGICYFELTRKHLDYGEVKKAKLSFSNAKSILKNYQDFEIELNDLETRINHYYD
ncbi:MAG: tetratricopeptide repeat protein [Lutibacter sp.]|uniref:tetratricopeptide repeat protein n=1 Tax=Lutibacter sp. TaxID=1925666 RepID=UPI00299DC619|nr:tetratricopeptide repeat protein [Lutibacter sp.]MDX1830136.1 tetratricopeptide repeat protein [Lutibacter sp.]